MARASRLLLLAAGRPAGITAADGAAHIGASVPTAHHLLNTLRDEGLLLKDPTRRFRLGPQAAVIADAVRRLDELPAPLAAAMEALAAETAETAYVTAWREGRIRVLGSTEGMGAVRVAAVPRGPYSRPHARASGKVLLAYADEDVRCSALAEPLDAVTASTITDPAALATELDRVRRRGWAEDREEFLPGVCCLAAPVVVGGVVVAALSLSVPAARFHRERTALRDAILRAAERAASGPSPTTYEEAA